MDGAAGPPGVTLSPGLTAQQRGQLGTAGHNGDMGTWGQWVTTGTAVRMADGDMGTWGQWVTMGTAVRMADGDMGTAGDSGSQQGQQLGWQMGTWGHGDSQTGMGTI